MAIQRWSTDQLRGFQAAAQSLKLYRRAELPGTETHPTLIEQLYVDPLPHDYVLETVLKPNTTFLIGRKGTGKSTIFQRLQQAVLKKKTHTSAYIDIKTIYESSQVDAVLLDELSRSDATVSADNLRKLLLYKAFLRTVIVEIKNELQRRTRSTFWERVKTTFTGGIDELFADLDELLAAADQDRFSSVLAARKISISRSESTRHEATRKAGVSTELGKGPRIKAQAGASRREESSMGGELEYADLLMRVFNIKDFLQELKRLLERLTIRHLYVLIDDFSELPEEAMRLVVDTLLAPLNNWSEEFIKFKIAAYPGRVYYGAIDKTKVDEVFLDLYKLYGTSDVSTMEKKASDFTQRLVEQRLRHYAHSSFEDFLERSREDVWRQLFFATMANPRILGYILHHLYESQLIYGRPIGVRAVRDAARRYYEEKIESYFALNQFLHEAFEERSSIFGLKELLEKIVSKAQRLRLHSSAVMREIEGQPPTSHFHVPVNFEPLLLTLELNFFTTKYYEMSDRDGRKVSVFSLNYGLCQKYSVEFGRPEGKREFRLYFVERVFDYTPILQEYIASNQEILCDNCGEQFGLERLEALKMYRMKCPVCEMGTCKVINLSRRYETLLRGVDEALLLPGTELGILHTLHTEAEPMFAADIAAELDCSYQLIGKRGKALWERGLVERDKNDQGRRTLQINKTAEKSYFGEASSAAELQVGPNREE